LKIVWRSMDEMAKIAGLPPTELRRIRGNRYMVVNNFCIAEINHITNTLSLNIINRRMKHPQVELFFTYFHEWLHIANWRLFRRRFFDSLIDWAEQRILQRTVYKVWR
jgi:hypothetical protein